MKRTEFSYDLPPELIASYPLEQRSASRLLCLDGRNGALEHRVFSDLPQLLEAGDLLVFNDTRVIPARLWGAKSSGGRVEILLERITSEQTALAHIRSSKSPKPGTVIYLSAEQGEDVSATALEVTGRDGSLFCLRALGEISLLQICNQLGHMPLPPYIDRPAEEADMERYQTVFAQRAGAVAAPTAGLHFTDELITACRKKGVATTHVTLHVGAGTFQPVRADDIEDHVMHAEYIEVGEESCRAVHRARNNGGRVIAVGTTAVRCLETAAVASGQVQPYTGDTRIFIYPGYRFRVVDAMVTNFHLPESTLLMLVSAFSGRTSIMSAYAEAVIQRYRFFSYGDAMFLTPREPA